MLLITYKITLSEGFFFQFLERRVGLVINYQVPFVLIEIIMIFQILFAKGKKSTHILQCDV